MKKFGFVGSLGLALVAASLMALMVAQGSSHREAPLISMDPTADTTDVYAFVSPEDPSTVTIIGAWIPFEEPAGGPNFYRFDDNARYEFYVDNDGDAAWDIAYFIQFTTQIQNPATFLYNTGPITSLTDADWNIRQTYTVTKVDSSGSRTVLGSNLPMPPDNIGPASTPNYEALAAAAVNTLSDGSKVFAGQRDDPFFVDLGGAFDLLTIRELPGTEGGVDGLNGYNVHAIALQIPIENLTKDGSTPTDPADDAAVIGVWSATSRPRIEALDASGVEHVTDAVVQLSAGFNFKLYEGPDQPAADAFATIDNLGTACRFNNDDQSWDCYDDDVPPALNDLQVVQTGNILVIFVPSASEWLIDPWVQVSRLAMPLVNEVVIPLGKKDLWNGTELTPTSDGQFLSHVTDPELAVIMNLLYNVNAPTTNRQDLVAVFLTGVPGLTMPPGAVPSEQMRLNVAIPPSEDENPFGVLGGDNAGFPNGRRLADDVTDIELRAVCGVTYKIFVDTNYPLNDVCNSLGDGINENDLPFMDEFPYLATPHQGFDHLHDHSDSGALTVAVLGGGIGGGLLMAGAMVGAITLKRSRRERAGAMIEIEE